jgi:hypothetical protein
MRLFVLGFAVGLVTSRVISYRIGTNWGVFIDRTGVGEANWTPPKPRADAMSAALARNWWAVALRLRDRREAPLPAAGFATT